MEIRGVIWYGDVGSRPRQADDSDTVYGKRRRYWDHLKFNLSDAIQGPAISMIHWSPWLLVRCDSILFVPRLVRMGVLAGSWLYLHDGFCSARGRKDFMCL